MNRNSLNKLVIANVRAGLGIRRESINHASAKIGIPITTFKRRLGNASPFTLDEVEKIAQHFGVNAATLISNSFPSGSVALTATSDNKKPSAGTEGNEAEKETTNEES